MTTADKNRMIAVTGATGLQGSAVARHLLANEWQVRALTRDPNSEKARALKGLGAEVIQADMNDLSKLTPAFQGAYGVFSVQNPMIGGVEAEIQQGRNVAEAARQAGVQHLVYSSAGPGVPGTGVPSWESKMVIAEVVRSLGLPFTIVRPMAFMELMTEKKFFPPVSAWQIMPKLVGGSRKIIWVCTDDLGCIVAKAFGQPEQFTGKEIQLGSDVLSLDDCRALYRAVMGKNPPRFPMPVWLFERFGFIGKDLTTMWRWLRDGTIDLDTTTTRAIHPGALSVGAFFETQKSAESKH